MSILNVLRSMVPRLAQGVRTGGAVVASTVHTSPVCTNSQQPPAARPLWLGQRSCHTISHKELVYPMEIDNADLERLMELYDTFLLDCDGVLWGTDHQTRWPNMNRSIQKLRDHGKQILFVTNNSMHAREFYLHKFKDMCDFEASASDVFSVNYAAAVYLKSIAKVRGKVFALGSKGMTQELNNVGLDNFGYGIDKDPISDFRDDLLNQALDPDVEAVLVGFDIHIGYNKIYKAASYLSRPECVYVSTNDVETRVRIGQNRIQPLTGALTAAVNAASERTPVVVGKPHGHLLACVLSAHPTIDLGRTIMVGDSMQTDITFANNAGIDSILVLSGATTARDYKNHRDTMGYDMPTYVLSSFARFGQVL